MQNLNLLQLLLKENFKYSVIDLKVLNELDAVTIESSKIEKKRAFYGPHLGRFVPYSGMSSANIAIDVSDIQGKKITAIIVEIKGASPFVRHSKGSSFSVQMFRADSTLTKPIKIFENAFQLTVHSKRSYNVKIDVSDMNVCVPETKYLIITTRAVPGSLTLRATKLSKNANSFFVQLLRSNEKDTFFNIINSDNIPKIYFEYEL